MMPATERLSPAWATTCGDAVERAPLVIVGAGVAGLSAAIEAARAGVPVVVIDEAEQPGGQIYRQLPQGFRPTDRASLGRDFRRGQELIAALDGLPIRFVGGTLAWGSFDGRVLELADRSRVWRLAADVLIVAAGAYDRAVPIAGWTLPGVLTVGGAQTILKTQRMRPGRRLLLAGTGPLLLVVASQMAKAGVEVVAVVDPVRPRALVRHAAALVRGWRLLKDGLGYRLTLARARVPWIAPAVLTRIDGDQAVERATIARVDADWRPIAGSEQTFDVDTVCVGYGLVPSTELLRALGCALRYDTLGDVWIPERSDEFETSLPHVYAVGDGAGVAGALVAADEGRIAGLAAARELGRLTVDAARDRMRASRRRLAGLIPFRAAMDAAYRIRPALYELADPQTVVCRCEEVRADAINRAIDAGARTMGEVKAWTRAGMGNCQARMCGLATVHLLARRSGQDIAPLGFYSSRPPIKPIDVATLIATDATGAAPAPDSSGRGPTAG
jgi:thioredoxin reductase/bacterioferritin-associated ferredoxin